MIKLKMIKLNLMIKKVMDVFKIILLKIELKWLIWDDFKKIKWFYFILNCSFRFLSIIYGMDFSLSGLAGLQLYDLCVKGELNVNNGTEMMERAIIKEFNGNQVGEDIVVTSDLYLEKVYPYDMIIINKNDLEIKRFIELKYRMDWNKDASNINKILNDKYYSSYNELFIGWSNSLFNYKMNYNVNQINHLDSDQLFDLWHHEKTNHIEKDLKLFKMKIIRDIMSGYDINIIINKFKILLNIDISYLGSDLKNKSDILKEFKKNVRNGYIIDHNLLEQQINNLYHKRLNECLLSDKKERFEKMVELNLSKRNFSERKLTLKTFPIKTINLNGYSKTFWDKSDIDMEESRYFKNNNNKEIRNNVLKEIKRFKK